MIRECYQKEESDNAKKLTKYTHQEKHKIYSKPFDEQFENVHSSNGHTVKRHILRDINGMDYDRVLDAAKLYSDTNDVELLPEIHKSETEIRRKIGLTGNSNPDLRTSNHGFIDIKSPFSRKNIVRNAIESSKQGAIVCITDDHLLIGESHLEQLSYSILNNREYTKNEVHWVVNGKLYKYNSHGRTRD